MIIKKIFAVMKESRNIKLYSAPAAQWIGTPAALYSAEGLPPLSPSGIMALLDIPANKQNDYIVMTDDFPECILLDDTNKNDMAMKMYDDLTICSGGRKMQVLTTGGNVYFVDEKYLKPFDDEESVTYYLRDKQVIVVKCGFFVKGLIAPIMPAESLVENLANIGRMAAHLPQFAQTETTETEV